jgi:hypothetical protein
MYLYHSSERRRIAAMRDLFQSLSHKGHEERFLVRSSSIKLCAFVPLCFILSENAGCAIEVKHAKGAMWQFSRDLSKALKTPPLVF